jgi:hypothetical protein
MCTNILPNCTLCNIKCIFVGFSVVHMKSPSVAVSHSKMAEEGEQEEELEEEEAGEESERARLPYSISPKAGSLSNTKDMGSQAIWTLSSAKPGSGVDRLRDEDLNVYWQSEGAAPHLIDVQFLKKVTISEVSIYLDYPNDEVRDALLTPTLPVIPRSSVFLSHCSTLILYSLFPLRATLPRRYPFAVAPTNRR